MLDRQKEQMKRGFDYQKTDRPDCFTCYQCIVEYARGGLCGYDDKPVHHGYRCALYGETSKPVGSDPVKQNELF
jgi:hypothetical protein